MLLCELLSAFKDHMKQSLLFLSSPKPDLNRMEDDNKLTHWWPSCCSIQTRHFRQNWITYALLPGKPSKHVQREIESWISWVLLLPLAPHYPLSLFSFTRLTLALFAYLYSLFFLSILSYPRLLSSLPASTMTSPSPFSGFPSLSPSLLCSSLPFHLLPFPATRDRYPNS